MRDALSTVVRYRHLLNESLAIGVEDAGANVLVREELVAEGAGSSRQATELAIGVLFRFCAALLGAHWRPRSVQFTHQAPPELYMHERIFRCPIVFGAEFNGFVFPAALLDRANPTADPAMARFAARFLESMSACNEPSTVLEVRKAIYILLPTGRATIEQIAQSLGMNVRTLQRRLDESGASFSALICGVRRELVQRYMGNARFPLGRIAELLGYANPSSFTRWFITQFDQPPARWRAMRQRRGPSAKTR